LNYSDSKVPALIVGATTPFFNRQPTDQELQSWFADRRLGIAAIAGSASKMIFIDDDRPKYGLTNQPFQPIVIKSSGEALNLPETICTQTAGGAYCYWYRVSDDQIAGLGSFTQDISQFSEKIDIKFNHGYVICPPTVMADGRSYTFLSKHGPEDGILIAQLPDHIYQTLQKYLQTKKSMNPQNGISSNPPGWIAEEFESYGSGNRNMFLNRLAGVYANAGIDDADLVIESILGLVKSFGSDEEHHLDTIRRTISVYLHKENKNKSIKKKLMSLKHQLFRGGLSLDVVESMLAPFLQCFGLTIGDLGLKQQTSELGRFKIPTPVELADQLLKENHYLATPIGEDGKGQVLAIYDEGVFRPSGDDRARRRILDLLGNNATEPRINSAIQILKEKIKVHQSALNSKALDLVNVKNGMLDWRTGQLFPHDPNYRSTFQLNVTYDPDAKSELLEKFLVDVLPPDSLNLSDQLMGYLLLPTAMFQLAFLLFGKGNNGKSTFLQMLESFLGEENVSATPLHVLSQRFTASTIENKLANICNDLPAYVMKDSSIFKMIVCGEPLLGERKNKDHYKFKPFARLIFSANEKPKSYDTSNGYFRRWVIIPFENKFVTPNKKGEVPSSANRAIPNLHEKLAAEDVKSALLNRALVGLRYIMDKEGFLVPASCEKELESYKQEADQIRAFSSSELVKESHAVIGKTALFERYRKWAEDEGFKPFNSRVFNEKIAEILKVGEIKTDPDGSGKRKFCWNGIRFRTEEDDRYLPENSGNPASEAQLPINFGDIESHRTDEKGEGLR
jgi:P4 family phage/plasmid primase-like protien